jgi:hypothetical protein
MRTHIRFRRDRLGIGVPMGLWISEPSSYSYAWQVNGSAVDSTNQPTPCSPPTSVAAPTAP